MKTLVKDGKSIYLFDDAKSVIISTENIIVGDPAEFIIADCNSTNTTLFEGVDAPADWSGHKYLFDGTNWTANPDLVDPATII